MEVIDRRISFNAGEISPWLDPRIDLDKYHAGARQMENMRPSIYGGAIKRSGTEYLGAARTASTAVRLIPFLGGNGTDYVLEFSHLKLRVWNADGTPALVASVADAAWVTSTAYTLGQVLSYSGANYEVLVAHTSNVFATDLAADKLRLYPVIEVVTVFEQDELNQIQFAQQNDVMYFSHPAHTPQVLLRKGAADWQCGPAKFEWPVTMGPNATRISVLPWANAYVDTWSAAVGYVVGNHVLSGGVVYVNKLASTNHVPPNGTYWTATTWSNAKVYSVDNVILYSGQYYVVRAPHTAATGSEPGTTAGETYYAKATRIDSVAPADAPSAPQAYSSATYYTEGTVVTYGGNYYVRTSYVVPIIKGVAPTGDGLSNDTWDKVSAPATALGNFIPKGESIVLESSEALFQSGHVGSLWVIGHRRDDTREFFDANVEAAGYTSNPLYVLGAWTASTTKENVANSTVVVHIERSTDLVTWEFYATITSLPVANNQILTGTEDEPAFLRLKLISKSGLGGNPLTVDLQAENGMQYGLASITGYTSSTQVTASVVAPIYDYERTTRWEEPAFTSVRGFPRAVTLHEGRLWFGGITAKPTTLWGSAVDAYWDFRLGTDDDRAQSYTVATDESSTIEWLVSQDLLAIGTSSGEWVLGQRPGDDLVKLRRNTSFGSAAVQGRAIGDALVYFQKSRRKLREFAFNFESDKFLSNDLNMLAEHLGDAEMLQLAIQRNPEAVVWVVTTRGDLLALTYERGQNVAGWCRITTQGTFESVAVVPGDQEEDHVWVCAVRSINGSTVRYVERIAPDMIRALKDGEESELVFSDAALVLNPSGTATGDVTVSGTLSEVFPTLEYDTDVETRPSYAADGTNYTLAAEKPKAYATLNPTGDENEIYLEAVTGGTGGNSISVEIAEPVAQVDVTFDITGPVIVVEPGSKTRMQVVADFGMGDGVISTSMLVTDFSEFGGVWESQPSGGYFYQLQGNTVEGWLFQKIQIGVGIVTGRSLQSSSLVEFPDDAVAWFNPFPGNQTVSITITPEASTAAQVIAAINADASASALVTASNATGSDGSGVVAAVGPVFLANGSNTIRWRLSGLNGTWLAASTETYPWDILPGDWAAVSPATGTPDILTASSAISGLSHLEGETVTVLADGAKHPDCVVSSGAITLNYPARTAVVGLEYDAIIEPTYLESRQVAEFSKVGKKRIHSLTAEFWKSAGAELSADGGTNWTPLETRTPLDRMDSNRTLFTGLREEKLDGRTDRQASVILRSTAPLPLNLLSMNIRYNLNTNT